MTGYQKDIETIEALKQQVGSSWDAINPESVARMRAQNRFKTGLEIAQYTADIMRTDMGEYDADSSIYTQSLGVWHGFIGQQKMISIKKHLKTTNKRYLYLSGWMVAALRSEFGPLPDQSMHEKTAVPALVEELYTFLRQADARELDLLFTALDNARIVGDDAKIAVLTSQIDNFETHVVPIIADIDAGFGNPEATYLLAKKMIEAGACAIQIENQVSDEKQCGHQDGKVTVPHEDFIAKINAVRYAFLELGIENGIIVSRTDSLGAGLTQKLAVTQEPGDLGDQYNSFLDVDEITEDDLGNGDVVIKRDGKLLPVPSGNRRGPLRARQHHVVAKRCRPTLDRNREAAHRSDRGHDERGAQGRPECQVGVQQQPIVQLDPQLSPADVRHPGRRGQGRVWL
jgi:isocitrate lyase